MKWYSVKKYTPPSCTNIFIRAILCKSFDGYIYDRYFVAMIEDFNEIELLSRWEMANGQDTLDLAVQMYQVTHFCIPDPVEIED